MTKEIEKIFHNLPHDFYGHVEVHFKNSEPGFARIVQTIQIKRSNGTPQGENNESSCSNPRE
jgi:hypothetical protein